MDLEGSELIPEHAVQSVIDEMQTQAQAGLRGRAWRTLDPATAKQLVGEQAESNSSSGIPVLLRSVRSGDASSSLASDDRYLVRWKQGTVVVSHLARRRARTEELRHAIVVWLPEAPTEVHVDCLTTIQDLPDD